MLERKMNRKIIILCGTILLIFIAMLLFAYVNITGRSSNLISSSTNQTVVQRGDFVKINYIVALEDGTIVDTSYENVAKNTGIYDENRDYSPLEFEVGAEKVIKGLDEAVIGMRLGEEKNVTISPEKAYGFRDEKLIQEVSLTIFDGSGIEPAPGVNIIIGDRFARILDVLDNTVIIDLNHPLAGKTLLFSIKVESINKTYLKKTYVNLTINETVTLKYFWLATCGWCRKEDPILYEFLKEHPTLDFVFLDISKEKGAREASRYGIIGTPAFVLIKGDTELVARGFLSEEALTEYVCSLLEDEKCLSGETKETREVDKWWE